MKVKGLNKQTQNLMWSSKTGEHPTPQWLFDELDTIFHFNLDVCATPENTKCPKFFDVVIDGLKQDWGGFTSFMNPPFSVDQLNMKGEPIMNARGKPKRKRIVDRWVAKAFHEGKKPNTIVVCLLPSRTDTVMFRHHIIYGYLIFLNGRLKFVGSKQPAPFPSLLTVFGEMTEEQRDALYKFASRHGVVMRNI